MSAISTTTSKRVDFFFGGASLILSFFTTTGEVIGLSSQNTNRPMVPTTARMMKTLSVSTPWFSRTAALMLPTTWLEMKIVKKMPL